MKVAKLLSHCVCFVIFFWGLSKASDTLKPGEVLKDEDTLVSAGKVFELGFFKSGESNYCYLGIWFRNDRKKKAVWVANRENPLLGSSLTLFIRSDGNMVMVDLREIPIIVNYGMFATSSNTSAKLLDSGNLVLTEGGMIAWQSFDFPSDTFLPGMKLGWFDMDTGNVRKQFLVSWLSLSVPTSGPFAVGLDGENRKLYTLWRRDRAFQHIGTSDGQSFRFFFQDSSDNNTFTYVANSKEIYIMFDSRGNSVFSWLVLTDTGKIAEYTMLNGEISVVENSVCNGTSSDSNDCLTQVRRFCQDGDEFSEVRGSMSNSLIVSGSDRLGPSDCEIMCKSNCSCTAYSSFREDEIGCRLYFGHKKDLKNIIGKGNTTVYIRGGAPEISDQRKRRLLLMITIPVVSLISLILVSFFYLPRRQYNPGGTRSCQTIIKCLWGHLAANGRAQFADGLQLHTNKDHELPLVNFSWISTATNNFSFANRLGEGGFGPVYKGNIGGHEFAVKRLSSTSGQGLEEFKNEVQLISRLQHRNLVRLLGCCIHREEKMLIYEYMPNKSLDSFIFDPIQKRQLDWAKRFHIIEGIAQGLLYLHKYSRLRIIHRDLKTSNILLDSYMNPKISDFGLARIFGENESKAKTKRVVGTHGYMSPEYLVHGLFSTKSDVFSFGVIMLEIVSGRRNVAFSQSDCILNLLGYAWELWKDGRSMELMDPMLAVSCSMSEVKLCVQVGLLCVQESAEERPTMSDVVSILSNERTTLPAPRRAAYGSLLSVGDAHDSQREEPKWSLNRVTLSAVEAR